MVPPSAWLPIAMGGRVLDGQLTVILLLPHYNTVNDALAAGEPFVPPPTDVDAIHHWCAG